MSTIMLPQPGYVDAGAYGSSYGFLGSVGFLCAGLHGRVDDGAPFHSVTPLGTQTIILA